MDFDAQATSSLSLSSNVQVEMDNQKPSTSYKIEDCQVEKKMTEDSEPDIENQMEFDGPCFIEELPPEMLMKILKYLNKNDLFNCRLANRKWNEIALEVLQSRDDVEIVFKCHRSKENGDLRIVGRRETATLENFIDYFEDSEETLFCSRFTFCSLHASVFQNVNLIKFFWDFGQRLKCLKLLIHSHLEDNSYDQDLTEVVEKVRDLLLNQLPNLQEFGISIFNFFHYSNPSGIKLFLPDSTSSTGKATTLQLPNLKVLYIDNTVLIRFPGIAGDLLEAATNLQKVLYCGALPWGSHFLFSPYLEKLPCLQVVRIDLTSELLSAVKEKCSAPLGFKLKEFELNVDQSVYNDRNIWPAASKFLSNLFQSSKDTLVKLKTAPLGFLPNLHLPKFSKLIVLLIEEPMNLNSEEISLPRLDLLESFPVLQFINLEVPWTSFFPAESVSSLPALDSLHVTGQGMTGEVIAQISEVCPNLKTFGIYDRESPLENFPEVGTAIWTLMKKLQSLYLAIDSSSPVNFFPAIDSCITGFSEDYCDDLYNLIVVEKSLRMEDVSEAELDAERQNPSILDLKDLKYLRITLVGELQDDFELYISEDDDDSDLDSSESGSSEDDDEEEDNKEAHAQELEKVNGQELEEEAEKYQEQKSQEKQVSEAEDNEMSKSNDFESGGSEDDNHENIQQQESAEAEKDQEQKQEQEVSEAEETSESESEDEDTFEQDVMEQKVITFISKEYALKLNKNLTFEIKIADLY